MRLTATAAFALSMLFASPAVAADYWVEAGKNGNGSKSSPFGSVQKALEQVSAGDTVHVRAGTYSEQLTTESAGTKGDPIRITGEGKVRIEAPDRVLDVRHPHHVFESIHFDANFASSDGVRVKDAGDGTIFRNVEVSRAGKDCIDLRSPEGVRIERSLIHDCLRWENGREDAHGIVAGAVRDLVIRNTEVHTFSGDAFQVDPDRQKPGWTDVRIIGCKFWLEPLPKKKQGFPAGKSPGENAIDTKTMETVSNRAELHVEDTVAYGYRNGFISNQAAFNIKESVEATFDGVTVYDSEIAFRLRGAVGSHPKGSVTHIYNAVLYDLDKAIRFEDGIQEPIEVYNATFGRGIDRNFQGAAVPEPEDQWLDIRNLLVLGDSIPSQASGSGNAKASDGGFRDVMNGDYRLAGKPAFVDQGEMLSAVTTDRRGASRPKGAGWDPGAYEHGAAPADAGGEDDAGPAGDAGAGLDASASHDVSPGDDIGGAISDISTGSDASGRDAAASDDGKSGGSEGCGCSGAGGRGAPGSGLLLLLLLAGTILARRAGATEPKRSGATASK